MIWLFSLWRVLYENLGKCCFLVLLSGCGNNTEESIPDKNEVKSAQTLDVSRVPTEVPIPANASNLIVIHKSMLDYQVKASVPGLTKYFWNKLKEDGWVYDEGYSFEGPQTADMKFEKEERICGVLLRQAEAEGVVLVQFSGPGGEPGINWEDLRGADGKPDPAYKE